MNTRVVSMLMLVTVLASYAVSNALAADDTVYTFAIGYYDNRLEYLDPVSHQIKGYHADIVDAVCDIANKTCELVWDKYDGCWQTKADERARGGSGLMANWYTACTAWLPTYERLLTFDFTHPMKKLNKVALYARSGSSHVYSDLSGLKVGFLSTWFSDDACLAQYTTDSKYPIEGADLPADDQKFTYDTSEALIAAVQNGDVDVAFAVKRPEFDNDLEQISPDDLPNKCAMTGSGMMTTKDNKEFIAWWNEAFTSLFDTPRYGEICKKLANEHGGRPGDDRSDICIDQ